MSLLERLLAHASAAELAAVRCWSDRPFAVRGPIERLPEVAALLGDASDPASHIARHRGPIVTCEFDFERLAERDVLCGATRAVAQYTAGVPVKLMSYHQSHPELAVWLQALARELGITSEAASGCTVFHCPPRARVPKHCDSCATFILQLEGRKRWLVTENRELPHPTYGVMPESANPIHPEVRAGLRTELSREMPADSLRLELSPGDVLYLPWGAWHATETDDQPSTSLSIYVDPPSRATALLGRLRARLVREAAWRGPLRRPVTDDDERLVAAEIERLIAALAGWLPESEPTSRNQPAAGASPAE